MSKKQFEHIENKFREAAENYRPPLVQEAWEKMEVLLDQELTRKPRPGGGFWLTSLLLLLLVGGGLGIYVYTVTPSEQTNTRVTKAAAPANGMITHPTAKNDQHLVPVKNSSDGVSKNGSADIAANEKHLRSPNTVAATTDNKVSKGIRQITSDRHPAALGHSPVQRIPVLQTSLSLDQPARQQVRREKGNSNTKKPAKKNDSNVSDPGQQVTDLVQPAGSTQVAADDVQVSIKDIDKPLAATNQKVVDKQVPPAKQEATTTTSEQLPVKEIASRLYFTASVATDGNAIPGSGDGKVTAMYGIGLGYQINKRFSIQTGLYAGSKRYSTDSAKGYYLKPGYWRTVNIRNIDADCYVINVPLSVRYNAVLGRRGQWYGVAGLSSYFMQKESYDYYYYYINSGMLQHKQEVYGDNSHWFSVMDLSIGYEHRLSRHVSLQGEPYLKMPLKGVGEGKVNLYSAGLMLGLKFRP